MSKLIQFVTVVVPLLLGALNTVLVVWLLVGINDLSSRVYSLQQRGYAYGAVPEPAVAPAVAEAAAGSAAPAAAAATAEAPSGKGLETLSEERIVEIGKRVYLAKGGNSCNDCHGVKGYDGRLKEAANLTLPNTWKAFKGDLAAMQDPVTQVIRYGGGAWNSKHPDPVYDVTMLGVAQGVSKSELRKIRKELKKKDKITISMDQALDLGAKATYAYLETLWVEEGKKAAPNAAE